LKSDFLVWSDNEFINDCVKNSVINCSDYATPTLQYAFSSKYILLAVNGLYCAKQIWYGSQLMLNTGGIHFLRPTMSSNSGGNDLLI